MRLPKTNRHELSPAHKNKFIGAVIAGNQWQMDAWYGRMMVLSRQLIMTHTPVGELILLLLKPFG
jgi:hypothetical protein